MYWNSINNNDYITSYAVPTAVITVNGTTQYEAEVSYFISDFASGYDYKINVINETIGAKEQTIYLDQEADTFVISNLNDGALYRLDLGATYEDPYTYEYDAQIIAEQYFNTPGSITAYVAMAATGFALTGAALITIGFYEKKRIIKISKKTGNSITYLFTKTKYQEIPLLFERKNSYVMRCYKIHDFYKLETALNKGKEDYKKEPNKKVAIIIKELEQEIDILKRTCNGYKEKHFPKKDKE